MLIYTPEEHIPIGELEKKDGLTVIRIKKPGKKVYEELTIEKFIRLLLKNAG